MKFNGAAALAASATTPHFARDVLAFVAKAAKFRNFGAFFFPNIRRGEPVLSIWSGSISDYWYRRNASSLLTNTAHVTELRGEIRQAPEDGALIRYWRPSPEDSRAEMYARAKLYGRVSVSSCSGATGLQSFFLRDHIDGPFKEDEVARLAEALPIAHTLITLRHRIVGTEAVLFVPGSNATSLRNRGVKGFVRLSPKEAEICDQIALGCSVADTALKIGLAANSVRTMRQRAYRKLAVHSASEVSALILKNKPWRDDSNQVF